MASKDTDVDVLTEALDELLEAQKEQKAVLLHQGTMLTHLEQREVPDIQGLSRRLEEVADAVDRFTSTPPAHIPQVARWRKIGVLLLTLVCGYTLCWATVQWLPNGALPPGFTRAAPVKQKGRF